MELGNIFPGKSLSISLSFKHYKQPSRNLCNVSFLTLLLFQNVITFYIFGSWKKLKCQGNQIKSCDNVQQVLNRRSILIVIQTMSFKRQVDDFFALLKTALMQDEGFFSIVWHWRMHIENICFSYMMGYYIMLLRG